MKGFIKTLCGLSLVFYLATSNWKSVLIVPIFLLVALVTTFAIWVFALILSLSPMCPDVDRDFLKPITFFAEAWDTFWNTEL